MRLPREFIQLPLAFDADRLLGEVEAIEEDSWRPHPEGHPGNSALPLIAAGGDPFNDTVAGPMAPTPHLARCEYLCQVVASFGSVLGRSRLMRLDEESEATPHVDTNYYWMGRVRIHVPIQTRPEVEFVCEQQSVHMGQGECWIFDTWRRHNVLNPAGGRRIHLVVDTIGSSAFWRLVEQASSGDGSEVQIVPHRPAEVPQLTCERWNFPPVMSPWEQQALSTPIWGEVAAGDEEALAALRRRVGAFNEDWHTAWAAHGPSRGGLPLFEAILAQFEADLGEYEGALQLGNGLDAVAALRQALVAPALSPELAGAPATPPQAVSAATHRASRQAPPAQAPPRVSGVDIERPLFIVGPPRSGTSLLFETLGRSPSVWTIGGESHAVIEGIPELHPLNRGYASNRLDAADANLTVSELLRHRFRAELRDREGRGPGADDSPLRMLEKTPKNALRVPFLDAVFPDALFIYLHRDPMACVASAIEAWESQRFVTYPDLPGWPGPPWSLALIPGWQPLAGLPLAEIAATQWQTITEVLLDDLAAVTPQRWSVTSYEDLVEDPQGELERICGFAELKWDQQLTSPLPLSGHTVSEPATEKWRARESELAPVMPRLKATAERARDLLQPAQ
jgi:Sulfotransferase family/Aspartyl/Asparaginyl beta-hydroxylase